MNVLLALRKVCASFQIVILIGVAFVVSSRSAADAAPIPFVTVSRDNFVDAFDTIRPAAPFNTVVDGAVGDVREEVFPGKGNNQGVNAYLYQILGDRDTVNQFTIFDFVTTGAQATVGGKTARAIVINEGVGPPPNEIDGFRTLGTVTPTIINESESLVSIGITIPDGGRSFIIGIFSSAPPGLGRGNIRGPVPPGNLGVDLNGVYTTVPEPSTLLLLGIGLLGLGAAAWRRRGGLDQ